MVTINIDEEIKVILENTLIIKSKMKRIDATSKEMRKVQMDAIDILSGLPMVFNHINLVCTSLNFINRELN